MIVYFAFTMGLKLLHDITYRTWTHKLVMIMPCTVTNLYHIGATLEVTSPATLDARIT